MGDQKLENSLNLALQVTAGEREESLELDVGYQRDERTWELIVRYSGELETVVPSDIEVTPLLHQYAIVKIPQSKIPVFAELAEVEYIEKPKRLFFALDRGRMASCISQVQSGRFDLTGKGVWMAVIDSGIDYSHPDFLRPDGSSRILYLWDQDIPGNPPKGYRQGSLYTKRDIDEALAQEIPRRYQIVPSQDSSGHGTSVMGIAAGNGASSGGIYRGAAWESDLIVVKLGRSGREGFPRTTELMQAVDFIVRLAMERSVPVVINLSFGNVYGSHEGDSLLETYLDAAAQTGRSVICVGTGNDGDRRGHTSGGLSGWEKREIPFAVSSYEPALNLQLWKQYEDEMRVTVIHPGGERFRLSSDNSGVNRVRMGSTTVLGYYGQPAPYSMAQEVYLDFLPEGEYIDSGVWKIELLGGRIVEGTYDMWVPGGGVLNPLTGFLEPNPERTLTIPSTAAKVISVGAYDARRLTYAVFSGRGYTRVTNQVKPTLAAPGVEITTTRMGGGYHMVTGTSFATPFVSGAAALLMEWGIVQGHDPYLYGEKVKAYLIRGAQKLPGFSRYPNPQVGYGTLCVGESIPL